jgi:hypothetical protein
MIQKFLLAPVMLCTALFIMLDAAPVLSSTASFKAAREQLSNEMVKMFLNMFSKSLATAGDKGGSDGSIQVDSKEIVLSFVDFIESFISDEREKTDPNDKSRQTCFNVFDTVFSLVRKQLSGKNVTNDEIWQTLFNSFVACLSSIFEDSEVHIQTHSYNEPAQKFFNLAESIFPDMKARFPTDELSQTSINGLKTLFSLFRKEFEEGGETQSSDDQMKLILSKSKERSESAEAQTLTELERTAINIMKMIFSAGIRNADPHSKVPQDFIDTIKEFLPLVAENLANEGDKQITDKTNQFLIKLFGSSLSVIKTMIENDEFPPVNEAILNIFSKFLSVASKDIDPNDDTAQTIFNGLREIQSALRSKINSGWGGQIQSSNELPWALLDLLGTLGSSALQTKASPRDDVAQTFLSFFNTLVSGAKTNIGGGGGGGGAQEVQVDTLPTYAAKHFDQGINAEMTEGDMNIIKETKAQLQGATRSGLASDFY